MAILTDIRNAVWQAVDFNVATAKPYIRTHLRFDVQLPYPNVQTTVPFPADCPALEIFPSSSLPRWYVHRNQLVPFALVFRLYTADWLVNVGEDLWEKVVRAVWNETGPSSSVPYVRQAGGKIVQNGPVSFTRVKAGSAGDGPRMLLTEFTIVLNVGFNPLIPNPIP